MMQKKTKMREHDNYSIMKGLEVKKRKYLKDRATGMTSREDITQRDCEKRKNCRVDDKKEKIVENYILLV